MNMYPQVGFSVYHEHPFNEWDISPLDLREEWARSPEEFEVYSVVRYDENGYLMGSNWNLTVLHHTSMGRIGIASNATADWADYDDVEQAVFDYLNDWEEFEARV